MLFYILIAILMALFPDFFQKFQFPIVGGLVTLFITLIFINKRKIDGSNQFAFYIALWVAVSFIYKGVLPHPYDGDIFVTGGYILFCGWFVIKLLRLRAINSSNL